MTRPIARVERLGVALGEVTAELALRIWEPPDSNRSVLCLHGFAGTGHDFEMLAETLAQTGVTVIAPDMIGRGESSFLGSDTAYSLRAYMACLTVAARFQKAEACHLGTSWGGLVLGAWLGATGWRSRGLVLNDIPLRSGPVVEQYRAALRSEAVASFASREEAARHLIESRRMEFLSGAQRERFVDSRVMQVGDRWRMRYDPAVAADYGMGLTFSLERMLIGAPIPILLAYGKDSLYADEPSLPAIVATNPRLQLLTGLDDPHPPSLMKLGQVLQLAGWFGQCFAARPA
jgi:pimeloyl-ACP methyl ester carboxylesterase